MPEFLNVVITLGDVLAFAAGYWVLKMIIEAIERRQQNDK